METPRICPVCSQPFHHDYDWTGYCSALCYDKAREAKAELAMQMAETLDIQEQAHLNNDGLPQNV